MSAIEERLTALERRECAPSKASDKCTVDAFRTKCLRVIIRSYSGPVHSA